MGSGAPSAAAGNVDARDARDDDGDVVDGPFPDAHLRIQRHASEAFGKPFRVFIVVRPAHVLDGVVGDVIPKAIGPGHNNICRATLGRRGQGRATRTRPYSFSFSSMVSPSEGSLIPISPTSSSRNRFPQPS